MLGEIRRRTVRIDPLRFYPAGVVIAIAGCLAVGATQLSAAGEATRCHGKPATFVGTDGPDKVKDFKKGVDLGKHPVIALKGGDDLVELTGERALQSVTICAGSGADEVEIFEGAAANRYLIDGGPGADRLGNGEGSTDFSDIEGMRILGRGGNDVLLGANLPDVIKGGGGDDRIEAGNGADRASGNGGADRIFGQGHADRLSGGRGSDLLIGDSKFYNPPGRDRADGGKGNDRCKAEVKRRCER